MSCGCYNHSTYEKGSSSKIMIYSMSDQGSYSGDYSFAQNSGIPSYAAMFYSPTKHEQATSIMYHNAAFDYDSGLKEIKEAMSGPPLEAYIPVIRESEGLGSASPQVQEKVEVAHKVVNNEIIEEIEKAQKKVIGRTVSIKETKEATKIKKKVKRTEIEQIKD